MKRIFPAIVVIAAMIVGASPSMFRPLPAGAQSTPVIVVSAVLSSPGDQVLVTNLVGQSTCSFFVSSGTAGAVDVQGTNDKTTSPAWTNVAALDYASPPAVQTQPFSPTTGTAYQFSPTSLTRARIVADASWTGGPATIIVTCTSAVARAGNAGGGGGGSVTGTAPILVAGGSAISFDYGSSGKFTASQSIGGDLTFCDSSFPTTLFFGNPSVSRTTNGTIGMDVSGNVIFGMTYNAVRGCAATAPAAIKISAESGLTALSFLPAPGNIRLPSFQDGCLWVGSGGVFSTSDSSTCQGGVPVAGLNITVTPTTSPIGGQIIALVPKPQVSNIDFTDTGLTAGTYAGLASDGAGNLKIVSTAASPCPSTGCGVVAVTASGPLSSTGLLIPNIAIASPIPRTLGGFGASTSAVADGLCPFTAGGGSTFTFGTCATPAPVATPVSVTASAPLSVATPSPGVFALSLGIVPANHAGLGTDASSFPDGDCPAFSVGLGHFIAAPCSSATSSPVTGGTNITVASNVVSTVSSPVFSGAITGNFISPINLNQTEIPALHLGTGAAGSGSVSTPNLSSIDTYSYNDGLLAIVFGTTQGSYIVNGNTSINDGIVPYTHSGGLDFQALARTMGLKFNRGSGAPGSACFHSNNSGSPVSTGYSFPCLQTFFGDGTSTLPGPVTIASVVVSPTKGQTSCTETIAVSCTATATVKAGTTCTATYDHATTVALAALLPLTESVSGTTASFFASTASALTGTIDIDFLCF